MFFGGSLLFAVFLRSCNEMATHAVSWVIIDGLLTNAFDFAYGRAELVTLAPGFRWLGDKSNSGSFFGTPGSILDNAFIVSKVFEVFKSAVSAKIINIEMTYKCLLINREFKIYNAASSTTRLNFISTMRAGQFYTVIDV